MNNDSPFRVSNNAGVQLFLLSVHLRNHRFELESRVTFANRVLFREE